MNAPDFLAGMAAASRARLAAQRAVESEAALLARARAASAAPALRLSPLGFDLIAEVKLRSPAAGALANAATDVAACARSYAAAGAAAVSVLTEPQRFDGSLAHLEQVTTALGGALPALRKDFLVDPYQVAEARAAGAGGVLLILRMLPHGELEALLDRAAELKMFVLLEAFDETDIDWAAELCNRYRARLSLLLGVNCRDLATLKVVPGRLENLARRLPMGVPWVAESGIDSPAAAARVAAAGYQVALIGSALMSADEPAALAISMLRAGREAAERRQEQS
jgi:indole-3-glycerol phosphate synthase